MPAKDIIAVPRWEYLTENMDFDMLARRLASLGADGWELITVVPTSDGSLLTVYKRQEIPCKTCNCDEDEMKACPYFLQTAGVKVNEEEVDDTCTGCYHFTEHGQREGRPHGHCNLVDAGCNERCEHYCVEDPSIS